MVLRRPWLSEMVIEYLYGFHAFCDGHGNINGLIKNIIHGRSRGLEGDLHREWSPSESRSRSHRIDIEEDLNNLDDPNLPIPTDSNLMGISQRIINTPNFEEENRETRYRGGSLLNDFMEEKYVENRRTSADGMVISHEDDRGLLSMWDELTLGAIRLQYDAFRKGKQSVQEEQAAIYRQHEKLLKSMEFYFDFIRSLHYNRTINENGE